MFCVRTNLFFLVALCLGSGNVMSQSLKVDVDHAVFASSPGESVVAVLVMLSGAEVSEITQKTIVFRFKAAGTDELIREVRAVAAAHPLGYLTTSVETVLPAGDYKVDIYGKRSDSERILARKDLSVHSFASGRRALISDVLVGRGGNDAAIESGTVDRDAIDLQPKPDLVFGRSHSRLYYYFETYNTDLAANGSGTYSAMVFIADANRAKPMAQWTHVSQRVAQALDRTAGVFSLDELPSGSYQLIAQLRSEDGRTLAERSKRFFVFNPGVAPLAADESMSAVLQHPDALSGTDLDRMLEQIGVIANPNEADRLKRLSSREEKLSFLDQFWSSRQTDTGARGDRTMMDFLRRIEMVNARFGSQRRDGWQTDQGATVLKYGEPSAIHVEDFNTGTNYPYEIWQYANLPGTGPALFVFMDRGGFGEFELIHSTAPGERRNVNWRRELMRPR